MSTPLRLGAFAALLAAVFGVALLAGGAIGPDRESAASERPAGHGEEQAGMAEHSGAADSGAAEHGGGAAESGAPDAVRGLAVADGGLRLALGTPSLPRGEAAALSFVIRDAHGAVRDFDVAHEKRMHAIVVRRDGRGFQHLHPTLRDDGTWTTPIRLPDPGAYRVFADFARDGRAYTLASDLTVDGAASYAPLPAPRTHTTTGGYTVDLRADGTELAFDITRDGKPVETEPYLGAGGHLVALREGDLAYLHVHPESEGVAFEADLDPSSRYRLYLQFKHAGAVHTAELVA